MLSCVAGLGQRWVSLGGRAAGVALALGAVTGWSAPAGGPAPYGAIPAARQRAWHELELYGFVHFTVNTFTDREWGYGDESPAVFNPTDFDAGALARIAKEAGLGGLILTAKHHDGFCLWPSRYTEHSIARSPYRGGRGDIVGELAAACRREGIRFGIYLSPWDRHRADYGQPSYLEYYRAQLTELLTHYGPIFEVWFDGANGGDGFYGGAREQRRIDAHSYYGWAETWALVRKLQPEAVIFSDGGPDVRWVGNERGRAGDPCWATLKAAEFSPGAADAARLNQGDRDGTHWVPAECDVSIRPGWFYHAAEDHQVKSGAELMELYFASVGRGASLLLNLPPDRRGRIHENDVAALRDFRERREALWAENLARGAKVAASNEREGGAEFGAARMVDGDKASFWAADDGVTEATVELDLGRGAVVGVVDLREPIRLGQRIDRFSVEIWREGCWREVARGTSIGARRLVRLEPVLTERVRLRVAGPVCPALAEVGLYRGAEAPPGAAAR